MPFIVVNNDTQVDISAISDKEIPYTYPENADGVKMDLRPSSTLHRRIVAKLLRYGLESISLRDRRTSVYQSIDDKLQAYIPADIAERRVQAEDKRKPISIVFPYTYAILETLVSYCMAAFAVDPIFRYEGTGPEDVAGAELMQRVIALQCTRNKVSLALHTMFRDAAAYGMGITAPTWAVEYGKKVVKNPVYGRDLQGNIVQNGFTRGLEDAVLFEGNALNNIDPYCYLPDPNAPIHDPQAGEFVSWLDSTNLMDLLSLEEEDSSTYFNIKYLKMLRNRSNSLFGLTHDKRNRHKGRSVSNDNLRGITNNVDLYHVFVKLVPNQWGLGKSSSPQKWLFTLAADCVLIRAQKLDLAHNRFPVTVAAPDFDGYSPVAYSRLEILSGMQTVIDWLFNSHIANVRKAVNDVLIVDPYMINMNDLKNPGPGGFVRLRRPGFGKGVKDAIMQLNVVDITRQNIADVSNIVQYMQSIGGTDNAVMGNLRRGGPERLSAQEYQGTAQGAVNRLERIAKVIGLQSMQDIGYMFASHTQQFISDDVWVKSVGGWSEAVHRNFNIQDGRVLVRPTDLLIDYDLLVKDGSIPGGNFNDSWVQLFQTIGNSPILAQRIDTFRLFTYIAQSLGAKNIEDFELKQPPQAVQLSTAPDAAIADQVQQGNLVAAGG